MALPPLIPLEQALEQLLAQLSVIAVREVVPLSAAFGRVLAQDLTAQIDVPPRANSSMDGYAVRRAECDVGAVLPVSQRIPAGHPPQALTPGTVARIFTGAEIPEGADAVVMQENTERLDAGRIKILKCPSEAENIRAAGLDLRAGSPILEAGTRLTAAALGVLASTGIAEVAVYRPIKVALLCTGDELVEPGQPLQPGQIYNSNRPLLGALLTQAGFDWVDLGRVEDTHQATRAALSRASREADAIITTGGVSVGEEDHVKNAISELGRIDLWRIKIRPGKPFAMGWVNDTPVIGLPGNPMSALVTFSLLGRPCLQKLQGAKRVDPLRIPVSVGFSRAPQTRDEYVRVCLEDGVARLIASQNSGVLSSALTADGLLHLPSDQVIHEGDRLDFIPFTGLLAG